MSTDYCLLYKKKYPPEEDMQGHEWDLFLSAYNDSDRVKIVYNKVNALNKHWLIMPDYEYDPEELPSVETSNSMCYISNNDASESEYVKEYFK